ncbi:hypothetical protein BC829DRAFT_434198 [Chytridium lagenaria]|nr:hypothetical protein BC829DRAFT_434198 [Chytridium lagenaria]
MAACRIPPTSKGIHHHLSNAHDQLRNIHTNSGPANITMKQGWTSLILHCPMLESLSVHKVDFWVDPNADLLATKGDFKLSRLIDLSVSFTPLESAQPLIDLLRHARNIATLELSATNLRERDLCRLFPHVPRLRTLRLGSLESSRRPGASTTGLGTVHGVQLAFALSLWCKELRSLDIAGTSSLTPLAFAWMVMVPLTMRDHCNVSAIVREVAVTLEFLELERVNVGNEALRDVARFCGRLKQLRVHELPITEMEAIVSGEEGFLPALEVLSLQGLMELKEAGTMLGETAEVACNKLAEATVMKLIEIWKLERLMYFAKNISEEFKKLKTQIMEEDVDGDEL